MNEVVGIYMLLLGVKMIAKVRVQSWADEEDLGCWMDVVSRLRMV